MLADQPSEQKRLAAADGRNAGARSKQWRKVPVVLLLLPQDFRIKRRLFAAVVRKKWHSLDLAFRRQHVPAEHQYQGAFVSGNPRDHNVIKMLRAGKPVVRLGSFPNLMDKLVPAVIPDWEVVGRMAAEHFAERDFKHVGFIGREPWNHFQPLYHSFEMHAQRLGIECHLLSAKPRRVGDNYDYLKSQILAWLETLPLPIGLLAFGDKWAAELVYICSEAGYALPEQVAILGVGNDPEVVNACVPNLSSVDLDNALSVDTSMRLLEQMMQGEHPAERTVRIPPKGVVVRTSTEILAVQDRAVAAALRYIWEHFDLDLSVTEVAEAVGVPRYKLERLFRMHLDRGVNEEIVRKRLEVFGDLLRNTDDAIGTLAARCGFRTLANLNRRFKHIHGVSPRAYRARLARD